LNIRAIGQRPAACVFDAYGTLFDVGSAVRKCAGVIGDAASSLIEVWRSKQLQYTWLRSVASQYVPFDQVTADALDYALDALGIANAGLRAKLLALYGTLDAFPDACRALTVLHESAVPCWILSNGTRDMLESTVRAAGIGASLRGILSADQVRVYKPDARVYRLAVEQLALEPQRIVFISANGWDAFAAAAFGFAAVWCNRAAAPAERLPGKLMCEIQSLDELPAAIC
jgi:2-haloacid dehalogenase